MKTKPERKSMRHVLVALLAVGTFAVGIGTAFAVPLDKPPAPPGQSPCSHGNTGKPCKPDPQPDKGKDCEEHGQKGGVNEDHCAGETKPPPTTEPPPTTTNPPGTNPNPPSNPPSNPPAGNPPAATPPATTPSAPGTTPPTVVPPVSKPPVAAPGPKGEPASKPQEQAPKSPAQAGVPENKGELPFTGLPLWSFVLLGLGMVGAGARLIRYGSGS